MTTTENYEAVQAEVKRLDAVCEAALAAAGLGVAVDADKSEHVPALDAAIALVEYMVTHSDDVFLSEGSFVHYCGLLRRLQTIRVKIQTGEVITAADRGLPPVVGILSSP